MSIPKGWRLVPDKPTEEMLRAFDYKDGLYYNPANKSEHYKALHTWEAMLAAAPHPPAQVVGPVAWIDQFGNAFPMRAWNGKFGWLDGHRINWRPLYTHPGDDEARKSCDTMGCDCTDERFIAVPEGE